MMTQAQALELFEYRDGDLYWRKRPRGGRVHADLRAGTAPSAGYRKVMVSGKNYLSHRVVWLMHHGSWPADMLDHINGVKADNRIENLRECTRSQNLAAKLGLQANNTSGIRGVSWHKKTGKWFAQVGVNKKNKYLGSFSSKEVAGAVYRQALVEHFGEFAPGEDGLAAE